MRNCSIRSVYLCTSVVTKGRFSRFLSRCAKNVSTKQEFFPHSNPIRCVVISVFVPIKFLLPLFYYTPPYTTSKGCEKFPSYYSLSIFYSELEIDVDTEMPCVLNYRTIQVFSLTQKYPLLEDAILYMLFIAAQMKH